MLIALGWLRSISLIFFWASLLEGLAPWTSLFGLYIPHFVRKAKTNWTVYIRGKHNLKFELKKTTKT